MSNETNNVFRNAGFNQVCVWPATIVVSEGADVAEQVTAIQEFEKFFLDSNGWRIQYLEEIKTNPDTDSAGVAVEGTGGRNDVLFAMHDDDIGKAAIPRLAMGIRWIEDVLSPINCGSMLYPDRVRFYQKWPIDGTIIDSTPNEPTVAAPAVAVSETNNTTKESTMNTNTENTVVEVATVEVSEPRTTEAEANSKMLTQLAASLFVILKPQLKAFIEETVAIELSSQVQDAVETMLESNTFERAVVSLIEGSVPPIGEIIDDESFNEAVREVVSEMEFSIAVEGDRGRRRR